MDKLTWTTISLETLKKYKINKCPFLFPFSFPFWRPHTDPSSLLVFPFPSSSQPFHLLFSMEEEEKKTLFLFLLFPSHLHRLMLKVCLRIVCNYACLHTEALLCVKVWKPFVAWGCEGKTAQTNFKQLQRHEDRWQTGASWLQTWVILYSNMLLGLCVGFVWADCCSLKCKHIKDRIKGSLGFFFSFDYPKLILPGFSSGFVQFLNDSDPDASFSWSVEH